MTGSRPAEMARAAPVLFVFRVPDVRGRFGGREARQRRTANSGDRERIVTWQRRSWATLSSKFRPARRIPRRRSVPRWVSAA
ncbi:hypothetical protein amb3145 [Paramagnetospirillum magneticum AMB-1]|uniref:Uncharacterized protein n=1 Tax=Paramagnetospirillum magneticum (strain ATCC 700264 / AMB-1) TaxID=342108 RepID=Q2W2H6_PARM1|nr:hypothetical protein amb3145 [Paramagnetospirillum magneticum AMB-1]